MNLINNRFIYQIKKYYHAILVCFIVILPVKAEISAENIMDKVYSGYSTKKKCWIGEMKYCMKIGKVNKLIINDNIVRYYIIAYGTPLEEILGENGEVYYAHAESGAIGAFIVEEYSNGSIKMLAGTSLFYINDFGHPPEDWQIVKLGANDYYGWQSTSSYAFNGCCNVSHHVILAPYGKKIIDIAGFVASYDDLFMCDDNDIRCRAKSTKLQSIIEIDSTRIFDKVFPVILSVTGRLKGKRINKTFLIPFNEKKWKYVPPKNYPLNDLLKMI